MSIVCVIEQTPGKLLLSTCPARQGGSILGTRGSRGSISGSGEKGKEGVCVIVLYRVAQLRIEGGEDVAIGSDGRCGGHMPRGEASPSPLAACATTKRAKTFRGVRIQFAGSQPISSRGQNHVGRPANGVQPTPHLVGASRRHYCPSTRCDQTYEKEGNLSIGETFQLC